MLIWGGTWVAGRHAVQAAPPLGIAVWRFLIAGGALLALVAWRHGGLPRPTRREWGLIAALGVTGIFLYNLCFLYGLQRLAAGHAALVVALNPVMAMLAAAWLAGERLTRAKLAGSAMALVGCLTVIGHGSPLAPLTGAVGLLTVAALIDRPAALLPDYLPTVWLAILFLALLGTTLGFTWFNQAVAQIGAARASIFINLVPVAAVLAGAWLLGERLGLSVLAGGALVLAGVVLTQRPARELAT